MCVCSPIALKFGTLVRYVAYPEACTSCLNCDGRVFHTRGPAAAKLLSPKVCVHGMGRHMSRRVSHVFEKKIKS